jgi:predicted ATPase/DNA-binding CsgD family transcriptional regulator
MSRGSAVASRRGRLFGREAELRELAAHVRRGTPVVTICGAAGVGKTALVREFCRQQGADTEVVEGHLDRHEPSQVTAEIATATCRGDEERRLVVAVEGVDEHRDAVESVLEAGVGQGGTFVLSAIRALGVEGERVIVLNSLQTPDDRSDGSVIRSPSVQLFLARAAEASALFSPTLADVRTVARICDLVGGLPLAIELAAARGRLLPLTLVEQQLADQATALEVLASSTRSAGRHASLRATLAWACGQLGGEEQELLWTLSVFVDTFSLEQVAAVTARPVSDVVDGVSALIEARLIDVGAEPTSHPRFRLPRLVRAFAGIELGRGRRGVDAMLVRERLACVVAARAREYAEADYYERDAAPAGERLLAGHHDVVASLAWDKSHNPRRALRTAVDLVPFVLKNAEDVVLREQVKATFETWLAELSSRSSLPAHYRLAAARLMFADCEPGRLARARATLEEGLRQARAEEQLDLLLSGLTVWVEAMRVTGDLEVTANAVSEGLALAERLDDQRWLCRFEAWQGMVCHQRGDITQALSHAKRALVRARRHKDGRGLLLAGILVFPFDHECVDVPGGPPTLEELYCLTEELGDVRRRLVVMSALFDRARRAGETATAARWVERRVDAVLRRRWWNDLGFSLMNAAVLAAALDEHASAARWHGAVTPDLDVLLAMFPPAHAVDYRSAIEMLRGRMGPEAFDAAVREGASAPWPRLATELLGYAGAVAAAGDPPPQEPTQSRMAGLTPREREVLAVIASGHSNKEAAKLLCVSAKTVMHHSVSIYRKLGVRSRAEATAWAVRRGVV